MVDLFSLFNFFHKQKHQYFISILESMQDDQYILIREDGIHKKVYPFTFIYHDISFFLNKMKIRLYVQFIYCV